jgi:hypothetical protein
MMWMDCPFSIQKEGRGTNTNSEGRVTNIRAEFLGV